MNRRHFSLYLPPSSLQFHAKLDVLFAAHTYAFQQPNMLHLACTISHYDNIITSHKITLFQLARSQSKPYEDLLIQRINKNIDLSFYFPNVYTLENVRASPFDEIWKMLLFSLEKNLEYFTNTYQRVSKNSVSITLVLAEKICPAFRIHIPEELFKGDVPCDVINAWRIPPCQLTFLVC